eukprot:Gregarina_sp_Pseudo_9__918@NODE_1589_length_1474_cov_16_294077_g1474_i0_p1_GENE_NODE_1589_length_1474_cov_16_294077_g1474_i0NODE_1589_length_1474_cov_16_294077_g1474_i0_p1_ORF_typecomplete_len205_score57_39Magobind/PF09282_10/2_4e13Magobind/PF09282_10/2_6e03ECM11/PF15463_6/2_9e03ECM11/PF15463_6/0_14PHM7_cyt/PF14703_6/8_3MscS_TM/PF12794_7/3_7Nnf1/PF03980_14/2_8e03Nnf1/PF03980_14/1_1_NODE_1589_length_1474_cov_16_294077_g1474_i04471061
MSKALVPPNVVVERSGAGETYIINEKGEKLIAATRRADGSIRKAIKVRPGFMPLEERERFVSRGTAIRRGIEEARAQPPGTTAEMLNEAQAEVVKKTRRKKASPKKQPAEAFFEIVEDIQPQAPAPKETPAAETPAATSLPEDLDGLDKRMKLTRRKLADARALEKRQDAGQQLLPNQEEKVNRIPAFEEELKLLERKIEELRI